MKNTCIAILVLLIMVHCTDNFLDIEPESTADVEDIYQTEDDFFQAVVGAYDELQSSGQYGENFQYLFDLRADLIGESSASLQDGIYYQIDRFLSRSENTIFSESWGSLYQGINRSNLILEKLEEVSLPSDFETQISAEARFIRALSYFNIVRIWGEAPLVTSVLSPDDAVGASKDDIQTIYDFITTELSEIAEQLPTIYEEVDEGRATQFAALALLGKVQLQQGNYEEAESALQSVINSGLYDLEPVFGDIFSIDNEWGQEIIFAIRWKRLVEETDLFFVRTTQPITVSETFLAEFDAEDQRLASANLSTIGSYSVPTKFADPSGTDGKTGMDFPVIRYADVLLMYAEAINEQAYQSSGEAFDMLNLVRTRAGLENLDNATITNQEEFRTALFQERRKELVYEGHVWFDMIRMDDPVARMSDAGLSITENNFIYPIPQSEINRINSSGFQQNEGYE